MEKQTESKFPDNLPQKWRTQLAPEASQPYFKSLGRFLVGEYKLKHPIYPPRHWILRAIQKVDFDQVKVVVLGQDPYHGAGQAIGLSFGVPNELLPKPPSLMNIFKELKSDLGIEIPKSQSDLTGWADQGVLLLNTVLTVRQGQAFSHRDKGWEQFTDRIIHILNERNSPLIFLLWGAAARKKKSFITNPHHIILESAHPSPLSAYNGFFGSKPFSQINSILTQKLAQKPIDWARVSDSKEHSNGGSFLDNAESDAKSHPPKML